MKIRPFADTDQTAVVALWQACELTRPWNDPVKDIARKQGIQPDWFLVGELDGAVIASVMFGYDGHRGWMNYLAVAPEHQGQGHAKALIAQGEALLLAAGCPKISLLVRRSNTQVLGFYEALGYGQDDVVSLGKRLIPDH
jgi:ribosomal protein S18 acetylase RimI-like enzyme